MSHRTGLPGSTITGIVTWPTLQQMLQSLQGEHKVVVTYFGEAESPDSERVAVYQVIAETPVPLEECAPLLFKK